MTTSVRVGSCQRHSLMVRVLFGLAGLVMTQYAADLFVSPASRGISSIRDYARVRMHESIGEVGFGKYAGETYQQVVETDPDYCSWVLGQAELSDASPAMTEFADYVRDNYPNIEAAESRSSTSGDLDDNIMRSGKYRGMAYADLIMEDPDYCDWVLSILDDDPNPQMRHFGEWLDDQREALEEAKSMAISAGTATVSFGKHRDQKYQWVLENEPDYCQWLLDQDDPHAKAVPFISWLLTQEIPEAPAGGGGSGGAPGKVSFGRHKGESYEDVYEKDLQFCQWVLDKYTEGEDIGSGMTAFAEWLYKQATEGQDAEVSEEA